MLKRRVRQHLLALFARCRQANFGHRLQEKRRYFSWLGQIKYRHRSFRADGIDQNRVGIRMKAQRVLDWPAFPLVPALRSTNSAADRSALFVGFPATMTESDFSGPCI